MTDLFDLAKPVRDAAWGECVRCLGSDTDNPTIFDGHRLGTHLQAVALAFASTKFKDIAQGGQVAPPAIFDIYVIALAQVAAHIAGTCRPIINDQPLSPTASGQVFLQKLAGAFFRALAHQEYGLLDFNISFKRNDDGSISPEAFDVRDMLDKGKQP